MKNGRVLLLLILFFGSVSLWAQVTPPGDPGGNPTPITGVEVLLAAGGMLGVRRLYSNWKKK